MGTIAPLKQRGASQSPVLEVSALWFSRQACKLGLCADLVLPFLQDSSFSC